MQSLQPANVESKVTCNTDDSKVVKCEKFNSGAHGSSVVPTSDPSTSGDKKLTFLNYLRQRSSKVLIKHLVEEEKINMVVLNLKPGDDYSLEVSLVKAEESNSGHNREQKGCLASSQVEEDNHLLHNRELNACLANGEVKEDNQPLYTLDLLLDYVDRQELPYALVDKWGTKYPQLFYNGCVIVQIKDFRYAEEPQIRYTALRPHNQSVINDSNIIADAVGARTLQNRLFIESSIVKGTHEHLNLNPSTAVGLRRFRQHICSTALIANKPMRHVVRHSQRLLSKRPKSEEDVRLGQIAEVPSKFLAGSVDHKVRTSVRKNVKADAAQSHVILRSILKPEERQQWKLVQDGRNHDERHHATNYNDSKTVEGARDVNSAIFNEHGSHSHVSEINSVPIVHQEAQKLVPQLQFERRVVVGQKDIVPTQTSNGSVNVSTDAPSSSSGNSSTGGCVVRSRLHLNHAFPPNSQRQSTLPSLISSVASSRNPFSSHVNQTVSPQPSSSLMVQDLNVARNDPKVGFHQSISVQSFGS